MSEYVTVNGNIVSRTDFNENSSRWGGYPQWKNKEYYSQDVLGSVIMLTDSRGNSKETYSYDAFGNQYGDNSYGNGWTTGVVNEYGYNGKRFDSAVGLADYGFRDYAPLVGRFTTVDPVKDGLNWYAYVGNDPVNFIDPLGLKGQKEFEEEVKKIVIESTVYYISSHLFPDSSIIYSLEYQEESKEIEESWESLKKSWENLQETLEKINESKEDSNQQDCERKMNE